MHQALAHIHIYLSKGKKLLKTPSYLYCINQIIEMNTYAFSNLSRPYTSIIYLTTSLTNTSQYLANFSCLPSSHIIALLPWELTPTIERNSSSINVAIPIGPSLTACTTCTTWIIIQLIVHYP